MRNILTIAFLVVGVSVFGQQKTAVYFDFNSDTPNSVSTANLQQWIARNPHVEIVKLAGYCDSVDANTYNKELSVRRINSVLEILKGNKISVKPTVELQPVGEDFKLSANAADNRRVDVFYVNPTNENSVTENPTVNGTKAVALKPEGLVTGNDSLSVEVKSKFVTAKKGDIIRIENIHFFLNSEKVIPQSEPVLQELYAIMRDNPKLKIEVHGHMCCNPNVNDTKLSFRRAKYIFSYLLKQGINLNRLGFKGFGSANPVFRIPERTSREEQANRRVEILIMAN